MNQTINPHRRANTVMSIDGMQPYSIARTAVMKERIVLDRGGSGGINGKGQKNQHLPMACLHDDSTIRGSRNETSGSSFLPYPQHPPINITSSMSSSYSLDWRKKQKFNNMKLPFPWKLHQLLEDLEQDGLQGIASWLPGGRSFRVHDPDKFRNEIMSYYFRQTKFTSFVRQLYIYGFAKIEEGPEMGGFFHPRFRRDKQCETLDLGRNQCATDRRRKGQKKRRRSNNITSNRSELPNAASGEGATSSAMLPSGSQSPPLMSSHLPRLQQIKVKETLKMVRCSSAIRSDNDATAGKVTSFMVPRTVVASPKIDGAGCCSTTAVVQTPTKSRSNAAKASASLISSQPARFSSMEDLLQWDEGVQLLLEPRTIEEMKSMPNP